VIEPTTPVERPSPLRRLGRGLGRAATAPLLVGWGLLLWLVATLAVRFVGHLVLHPDSRVLLAVLFAATTPVVLAATLPLYRLMRLDAARRPAAAALIAMPGIAMDAFLMPSFASAFPNLTPQHGPALAAWLLWAYGLVLLTGFLPRPRPSAQ
jgi:hypothetical protein